MKRRSPSPTEPEIVQLDVEQLGRALDQIEQTLGSETAHLFRTLLGAYQTLLKLIERKNITVRWLRRICFGGSEKTRDVVPPNTSDKNTSDKNTSDENTSDENTSDENTSADATAETKSDAGEAADGPSPKEANPNDKDAAGSNDPGASSDPGERPRPRGHGRLGADAYVGCLRIQVRHPSFEPGDACPNCQTGTLYQQRRWAKIVRLTGQAPVGGVVYEMERLRCGTCGQIFTAPTPDDAAEQKYDPSVASVVALLRYGLGMPFSRLEQWQQWAGVPFPSSTQWEVVRDAAKAFEAVYQQLTYDAAQGELIYNDDTHMRILDLIVKRKQGQPLRLDAPDRVGVNTTCILSFAKHRPAIALFSTGPYHSGENLARLLSVRESGLPPPMQMCDGLSHNIPKEFETILINCMSHARRNFVDLAEVFPKEVEFILESFKVVYQTDAQAKDQSLSPEDRLRLHQEVSGPVMEELKKWLALQFDEKRVEPNSSLGQAIKYLQNHWEQLTRFLHVAGAPLDNNLCERALKMAIRHRKNSLFYKTKNGSAVGDIYMSLIYTCTFSEVDPLDYLTELQRHQAEATSAPALWLPWNYRQQLERQGPQSSSEARASAT